jgi:hypothetical protein
VLGHDDLEMACRGYSDPAWCGSLSSPAGRDVVNADDDALGERQNRRLARLVEAVRLGPELDKCRFIRCEGIRLRDAKKAPAQ